MALLPSLLLVVWIFPYFFLGFAGWVLGADPNAKTGSKPTPGLVYLSRLPPGLGPSKVKHLLSAYGEVGRIFLVRDGNDKEERKRDGRVKEKHREHRFKEGWVEFEDKKVARTVAGLLNAQIIGGKKGTKYHDDIWTMSYLPKFRWDQLSEQLALERATTTSLLRHHLESSKKEQEAYLQQVERAKTSQKIDKKRKLQAEEKGEDVSVEGKEGKKKKARSFRQREVVSKDGTGGEGLESVLGRLF
ncbi:hypothetical protein T439DRAFT_343795 [Meredithblackwellia eburnea MCA 4105]